MLQQFDVLIELDHTLPIWPESELSNDANLKIIFNKKTVQGIGTDI
jgi:hypothetical protein